MKKSHHGDPSRENKFWVYPNASTPLQNPKWDTHNPDHLCDNYECLTKGVTAFNFLYAGDTCTEYRCLGHDKLYHGDKSRSYGIYVHPQGSKLQNCYDCYSPTDLGCDNYVEAGQEGEARCFRCQGHVAKPVDEIYSGYNVEKSEPSVQRSEDIVKKPAADQASMSETKTQTYVCQAQSGWTRDLTSWIRNDDARLTQKLMDAILAAPGQWFRSQTFSARMSRHQTVSPAFDVALAGILKELIANRLEGTKFTEVKWEQFHKNYALLKQRQRRRRMDVFILVFKVKFPQVHVCRDVSDRGEDVLKIRQPADFPESYTQIVKTVLGLGDVPIELGGALLEAPLYVAVPNDPQHTVRTSALLNDADCVDWFLAHRRTPRDAHLIVICTREKARDYAAKWQYALIDEDRITVPAVFVDCGTSAAANEKADADVAMEIAVPVMPEGMKPPQLNRTKWMETHPSIVNMRMQYNPAVSTEFEIIVSVPAVGWTPTTEKALPPSFDGYPIRVVAGWSDPCCGREQKDRIYPGLAIGAPQLLQFGTIGGFIRFNGLFYIITCQHVMCAHPYFPETTILPGTPIFHSTPVALQEVNDPRSPRHIGYYVGGCQEPDVGDFALIELREDLDLPCFFRTMDVPGGMTPPELVFDIGVYGLQLFSFSVMMDNETIPACPYPVIGRGAGACSAEFVPCRLGAGVANGVVDRRIGSLLPANQEMTPGNSGTLYWTANFERNPNGTLIYRDEVDDEEKMTVGMGCRRMLEERGPSITLISPIKHVMEGFCQVLTGDAMQLWVAENLN